MRPPLFWLFVLLVLPCWAQQAPFTVNGWINTTLHNPLRFYMLSEYEDDSLFYKRHAAVDCASALLDVNAQTDATFIVRAKKEAISR